MINDRTKIDVRKVKYPIVKAAIDGCGCSTVENDPTAEIVWWDGNISNEDFMTVHPNQRISKIPGMDYLCYKSAFFQALNQMQDLFPSYFNFFPTTFLLPYQFNEFQREHIRSCSRGTSSTWIVKPRSGCCGNGIKLCQNAFDLAEMRTPAIVQRYISPYLIDGYKFDFRFYLLIATLKPFTAYIYHEGIARFCTEKYQPPNRTNLENRFSHLTNTAVNVTNKTAHNDFTQLASEVLQRISKADFRGRTLWDRIKVAARFSLVAQYSPIVLSIRNHTVDVRTTRKRKKLEEPPVYGPALDSLHRYFHIVGIDVMLNDRLEPVVLEMNDRPSMCVTFDLENALKTQMVSDALKIITTDGSQCPPEAVPESWEPLLPVEPGQPYATTIKMMFQKSMDAIAPKLTITKAVRTGYALPSQRTQHQHQ